MLDTAGSVKDQYELDVQLSTAEKIEEHSK